MSDLTSENPSSAPSKRQGTVLGGAVIVAGTAIGAGMFSLPVATSGLWFGYSLVVMALVWYGMYSAALYLLEATLRFPKGASFDTIAQATIGNVGRVINGASVAFLCYILTYAYISGGSSIIQYTVDSFGAADIPSPVASLIFAIVLAFIVTCGHRAVDNVSKALIGGMIITFLWSVHGLLTNASPSTLFPPLPLSEAAPYALGALGFFTVSFGMQTAVPSITTYLEKDGTKVRRALLVGSLMAFAFYVLWQYSFFGNIQRDHFPAIIAAGGNIDDLLMALDNVGLSDNVTVILQWFANMAVASSFLGVSLCLFDYVADLFGFSNDWNGRLKSAAITFIPPTVLGMFLSDGFITAIAFAGMVLVVFCILSPVLMAYKGRTAENTDEFRVSGGNVRMIGVFLFGVVAIILASLDLLGMLPKFG